jgi:hypothetical protein
MPIWHVRKSEILIAIMNALGISAAVSFLLRWPPVYESGPPFAWTILLMQMGADIARLFVFVALLDLAAIRLARLACGRHASTAFRLVAAPFLGALVFSLIGAAFAFEGSLADTSGAIYFIHAAQREASKIFLPFFSAIFIFEFVVQLLAQFAIGSRSPDRPR